MKKLVNIILSLCISACTIPIHDPEQVRFSNTAHTHTNAYTKINTYAVNLENVFVSLETNYDITTEDFQRKLDAIKSEYELFEDTFQSNKNNLTREEYLSLGRRREKFKNRIITNKVRYIETNNLPDERWGN